LKFKRLLSFRLLPGTRLYKTLGGRAIVDTQQKGLSPAVDSFEKALKQRSDHPLAIAYSMDGRQLEA